MVYKLVIADSSPSVQKAVRLAFAGPDFEVFSFDNGQEVMKALGEMRPDVVLLSLSLPGPGIDGYDIAAHLRSLQESQQTALLFLKGVFEPFDEGRTAGVEHDGVVQKPFDSEKLARLVRAAIDRKHDLMHFPEFPPAEGHEEGRPQEGLPKDMPSAWMAQVEQRIRILLKDEAVSMERELEKRIRAKVFAELKARSSERSEGRGKSGPSR